MLISKAKIDASYPDEQFSIPGYVLYRNNRKKGSGGIMVLVSSLLSEKRLKPDKHYKTLELIALEIKTVFGNIIILGMYCPPRFICAATTGYTVLLENELSHVCNWASLQGTSVLVIWRLKFRQIAS